MEIEKIIEITNKVNEDKEFLELQDKIVNRITDLIKDDDIDVNSIESKIIISRIRDCLNSSLGYKIAKVGFKILEHQSNR